MPGQLLRLRLLGSPSKLLVPPVLNRAFPFKLKYYSGISPPFPSLSSAGCRVFSSARRGNPNSKGKSLMEDEAELSDWVSDLKMSNGEGNEGRERIRFNGGGREGIRGRDGGIVRDRVRSDVYRGGNRGEGGRGRNYPPSLRRNSGENSVRGRDSEVRRRPPRGPESRPARKMMVHDDDNDDGGGGSGGRGRGIRSLSSRPKRGRMTSSLRTSNDDDNDDDEYDGRILSSSSMSKRGRRDSMFKISDDDDDDDDEDEDEDEDEDDDDGGGRGIRSFLSRSKMGKMTSSFKISDDDDDSGIRASSSMRKKGRRDSASKIYDDNDDVGGRGIRSSSTSTRGRADSSLKITYEVDDENIDDDGDDDDEIKIRYSEHREESKTKSTASQCDDSYLTDSRFDQCDLSPLSLKGVKAAGYERMTVVQAATLPEILKGKDVLAKAKTGTGKTVAFLLPSIEVVTKLGPVDRDQKRQPINVLVVCPTRELANQAAMEAEKLLKFHASIGVQVVTGGTRLALEQKRMQANPCQILVATPGRLRDHIENTPGFATRLMGVKVLVLDEADHLLDMGFRKDIERIIAAVPKQRQTLLFSATVPDEVRQICYIALKRDHEFVNTVEEGEETHSQVSQLLLVAPLDKQFPTIYGLLSDHIADNVDYKVLVFCTTAMVTKLVAEVLSELNLNIREMHSRKPQSYRTRVSDEFRKSKGIILVTSDVSARGVDYPDVTLVIQVGMPSDREQYIHRLGRTGRKGKQGQGILLLAPWEEFFLSTVKDLPISKASPPLLDPDTRKKVERALAHVEMKNKEAAYQAWLGYYNSNKAIGRDKARLVSLANEFSRSMGLENPPALSKLILGKMGLRNVPGLRSK